MRGLIVGLFASLVSTSLTATCESVAGNLLAAHNCGFERDASGWSASAGAQVSREAAEKGALRAKSDSGGSLTVAGPCVPAAAGTGHRISARVRLAEGEAYFCSVNAFQFADARCSEDAQPLGSAAGPPGPAWRTLDGSATTGSTTASVQLRADCSGAPGFVVLLDDFVLSAN